MERAALAVGLVAFLVIEAVVIGWCVAEYGASGTLARLIEPVPLLVIVDFTFASVAMLVWMVRDARRRGALLWPWLAMFVVVPTLGLFSYLLARPDSTGEGSPRP